MFNCANECSCRIGTWSKRSKCVNGRRILGKDTEQIDYDFDSEAEWEEDEEGEECKSDDEEEDADDPSDQEEEVSSRRIAMLIVSSGYRIANVHTCSCLTT